MSDHNEGWSRRTADHYVREAIRRLDDLVIERVPQERREEYRRVQEELGELRRQLAVVGDMEANDDG